ncbi:hypothetical protein [Pseudomonas aeruginosa]
MSDDSEMITGQTLLTDEGRHML